MKNTKFLLPMLLSAAAVSFAPALVADDLTWAGTTDSNTWNNSEQNTNWLNGEASDYFTSGDESVAGDNVTFTADAENKTVDVAENISAGTITVSDNYTFTTALADGATVTGSSLTVSSGATLTVDSGVTVDLSGSATAGFSIDGALAGTGTLSLALTSPASYANAINLGTTGDTFTGTVNVTAGCFTLNTSNIGSGTYSLDDGVNVQVSAWGATNANDFIFNGTTQLHVNSGKTMTLSGDLSGVGTLDKRAAGTLTVTGDVDLSGFSSSSGQGSTTFSGVSTDIDTVTVSQGTVNFGGATTTIGALTLNGGTGAVVFTENATIGSIAVSSSSESGTGRSITIAEGATVNVTESFNNAWGLKTLEVNGALNVAGDFRYSTGTSSNAVTGTGTIEVGSLTMGNQGTHTFGENLTLNVLGDASIRYTNDATYKGTINATFNGKTTIGGTLSVGNANTEATVTFNGEATLGALSQSSAGTSTITIGESGALTITGTAGESTITSLSGEGSLTLSGGTLTLSGENTSWSGSTTVSAGTLVAASDSALGLETVSISISGGQLSVAENVTLNKSVISIVLSETYNSTGGIAAIDGNGSLAAGTTISLSLDETLANEIAASETGLSFQILSGTFAEKNEITEDSFIFDNLGESYEWNYDAASGVLTLSNVPEPSAFGLLAGLGALALVAARRRRSHKAA